ncbi:MAG: glucose-1-phosphate cytidylyltransferase [Candidatus Marinimicrobia bacterium]|jgi:glucose-1-phosphate cytidylyltransferase|nr:glucose-1-phosphate cytidylyltransferase [Candidatus Neomarinimicrobiota bacterium]MBT3633478.1 glucose-1-phosphate cytidylyltransferase [Candidatus Neomarinimicrobiota bacterium]MBT3681620.1 glucose-1-phosphate cytidylyltransferase [Candidatus Neomarinimicrobiota bacterium]MBT3758412.1 glucose-1-phosphate cytidylyltransferase [Candidatus Neomarinimicrobiota bacterium]MBT3894934.1 glucose-1-phosphate cytidylyltransferase [Candidatus Neomarinimicrobiota bacterium]
MKVIILCGGKGTRLREETDYQPKPMVNVGGKPILWHIMKVYAHYGYTDFILALGYKGNIIRDYFLNYDYYTSDFTIQLGEKRHITMHNNHIEKGWRITMVETGEDNMTGSRIKQCQPFINDENFMLTYGDGVSNVNITQLVEFHNSHQKKGTITGGSPNSRWGEMVVNGNAITRFTEKPDNNKNLINGGFMVFNSKIFDSIPNDPDCVFEKGPLSNLALEDELRMFKHDGFWSAMDTYRDYLLLNRLHKESPPPWFDFS